MLNILLNPTVKILKIKIVHSQSNKLINIIYTLNNINYEAFFKAK